jgi:hypothetical protein
MGVRRIRGKADSRIKGVLWGCSFGILGGAFLGYLAGPGKVWATATALGIFVGGLGGAIHGAAVSPKRKKSESMPQAGGVVDRELDG